ncbi:MAG: hypothetical protein NC548_35505 [Lachnospiraceae bacterium]|nr:hypothetical protein [Lachnospiraceae bacterium]
MQTRQNKERAKWIITAIALVLIFVMVAGLILEVFGMGKMKPSGWFSKEEQAEPFTEKAVGGLIIPSETVGNDIALMSSVIEAEDYEDYGISPQVDSAYTVTAVVYPELATNRNIIWSLAWENASNAWAQGKTVTDYVNFTEVAGVENMVRVSCSQGFNERIILTAAAESEPYITAEVPINYVIRVIGMTVTFKGTDKLNNNASVSKTVSTGTPSPFGGNIDVYSFSWDEDIEVTDIQCSAFFSNVGTVADKYTLSCAWKHSSSWITAQQSIQTGISHFCTCANDNTVHYGASCNCGKKLHIGRYLGVCDSTALSTLRNNSAGGVTIRNLYQSMVRNHYCMEFTLSAFGEHCTYQRTIACNFDDSVKIAAEQVETTASSGLFF